MEVSYPGEVRDIPGLGAAGSTEIAERAVERAVDYLAGLFVLATHQTLAPLAVRARPAALIAYGALCDWYVRKDRELAVALPSRSVWRENASAI